MFYVKLGRRSSQMNIFLKIFPVSSLFLNQILQLTTEYTAQHSRNQNNYNHEEHKE